MKRLKSILVILAAVLLTAPVVQAETVSRRDAQRVAELFFNAARGIRMAPPNYTFSGRNFTTNGLFIPFYVFSHPTSSAPRTRHIPSWPTRSRASSRPVACRPGRRLCLTSTDAISSSSATIRRHPRRPSRPGVTFSTISLRCFSRSSTSPTCFCPGTRSRPR